MKELSKSLEAAKQRISQLTSSGDDTDESERPLLELRNQIKTLQDQNDGTSICFNVSLLVSLLSPVRVERASRSASTPSGRLQSVESR